jgi:hypothetical protein
MSNADDIKRLETKMGDLVDGVLGKKDGLVKVAHPSAEMSNNSYKQYRSSFLTLSDMQIPSDFRDIFKWCRYFFKFDSLVGPAVRALATFPITDYVVNDSQAAEEDDSLEEEDTSESYKFYKNMLSELNLYKHITEIGYDYWLYGNCIIFAEPGTKMVKSRNPETGEIIEKKQVVWKNVRRLDPSRVRIDRDPSTQEKIFYYEVPPELKAIIVSKKPKDKYDKIPKMFKEAVEKNGIIRLNSKFVYHFAMPSESGDSGLWATPPILHAMKLILYTNVLRQAQEAIAYEHIVPKRIYYFSETNTTEPNFDFGRVADDFAFELKKQLNDPNYQVISPIPIQQLQHGGQGKNLLLVPEIEQLQNTILATMSLPREFIFGGVSYSGSATSLRILENNFITYRSLLEEYVNNFLIKGLAEIRGEWEVPDDDEKLVTVSFADLKMQDDIQQKELMIRLNQQGKIPDEVLYEKVLGLDATKIMEQLRTESRKKLEDQFELQTLQFELQQKMSVATGGQATMGEDQIEPTVADPNQAGAAPMEQAPAEQQKVAGPSETEQPPIDNQQALSIAQQLQQLPESQVDAMLMKLPESARTKVQTYYYQLKDQDDMQADMRPAPEKLPPRREGGS